MRIHHLVMTGIGPYAGTETIDFDALSGSGRFLLTGPTGSGKTTVIDAIVFALYGEVTDPSDSSRDRIRSTLVSPQSLSAVELVVSTTAGIYRVRRTPAYERPKKRGQGTTTQNGTVRLWRLAQVGGDPVGEPLTRMGEVDAQIRHVIGLSREQLTQTVVLPQGKFARFLRADSTQRQGLLKDVFGTGVYDAIQSQLAEAARTAARSAEKAAAGLRAQVRALALEPVVSASTSQPAEPAPGVQEPGSPPPWSPGTSSAPGAPGAPSLVETLETGLDAAVPDLTALREASARARDLSSQAVEDSRLSSQEALAHLLQARQAREEARALHDRLERRRDLLARQHALRQRAAQDALDEERLQAAHRADRTVPALRSAAAARRRATAAVSALTLLLSQASAETAQEEPRAILTALGRQARRQLDTLAGGQPSCASDRPRSRSAPVTDPDTSPSDLGTHALEQRVGWLRREHGRLEAVVTQESGLAARLQEVDRQSGALARTEEELQARAALLAGRPGQRAELVRRLDAAQAARERLTGLEHQHRQAEEQHRAAAATALLSAQLGRQQDDLTQAAEAAARAAAQVHTVRTRWISSAAGTLAGSLTAGEPCPVCGSRDHPAPATAHDEAATREQVEAAEERQARADGELVKARRLVEETRIRLEESRRTSGGASLEEAVSALEKARETLVSTRSLAQEGRDRADRLAEFDAASERLRTEQERERTCLARSRSTLEEQRRQLAEDQERCERVRGTWPSVAARAASLLEEAEELEAVSRAVRQAGTALAGARQADKELETCLGTEGFSSTSEVACSLLGRGERERLAAAVRDARSAWEQVRLSLAEPQVATLTGSEEDHLEEALLAEARAEAAHQEASTRHARMQEGHAHLERACDCVEEAVSTYEEAVGRHAPLLRVAALARGENPAGTPLATWVLQTRFDEVLVFANERLSQMSSGRYELVRVGDEPGSRSRRRGLGLAVIDHLGVEHRRDPRTLSGGETFYVSLALALALADVVSAESGGVALETLFIDEGFGSLDPETLQVVMTEIERLHAEGRTVGIVSHVEELRHQVPDQIQVRRLPSGGSTLRVVP